MPSSRVGEALDGADVEIACYKTRTLVSDCASMYVPSVYLSTHLPAYLPS